MPRLYIGSDPNLISELATTTESTSQGGRKLYHPQKKDDEHRTDALRCLALGIRDLPRDGDSDTIFGGWVDAGIFGGVGVTDYYRGHNWKPPWS